MIDYEPAMWSYGFGRLQAKREAEGRAKERSAREAEPVLSLKRFEVSGPEASAMVKNDDSRAVSVSNVLFLEVLEPPKVIEKKGLILKKTMVKVAERIDVRVRPKRIYGAPEGGLRALNGPSQAPKG